MGASILFEAETSDDLKIALPKGRMETGVRQLLADAGVRVAESARGYRPTVSLPGAVAKRLKPQNIVEMLGAGSRDLGFAGADWVAELGVDVVELLDTELDPVRVVAAAPFDTRLEDAKLVATEYVSLTEAWLASRGLSATIVRTFGATEVFPPEDADFIVDNTATGSTLRANQLEIVDELMRSSTRLYASRAAMADPGRRQRIEDLAALLTGVLEARRRAMVELNVDDGRLDAVLDILPSMRRPTVSRLAGEGGWAIRAAVPRDALPTVVAALRARGGTDVVVSRAEQILS
jgi:ATP phosphoribosyltransferase